MIRALIRIVAKIMSPILNDWHHNVLPERMKQITNSKKTTRFFSTANVVNVSKSKNSILLGNHTWIKGHLVTFQSGKIIIGDYCILGENSHIWAAKKVQIGNRVLIAHNVNIHDNISHPIDKNERFEDYKQIITTGFEEIDLKAKPVIIEDDVWIGFNVTILRGVTIGKGSIIGACSIITKDVSPNTIVTSKVQNIFREI